MVRSLIPVLGLGVALLPTASLARTPNTPFSSLQKKVQRYSKYFNNAHAAVRKGAVVPHTRVRNIGVLGQLAGGASVHRTRAVEVRKGMEVSHSGCRVGGELGNAVNAGPHAQKLTYFPRDRNTRESTVPGREKTGTLRPSRNHFAAAGPNLRGFGGDWGAGVGSSLGRARYRLAVDSAPKKGAMLTHIEKGRNLALAAQAALRGKSPTDAIALINAMEKLHGKIKVEKQQLNADYRRAYREGRYPVTPAFNPTP